MIFSIVRFAKSEKKCPEIAVLNTQTLVPLFKSPCPSEVFDSLNIVLNIPGVICAEVSRESRGGFVLSILHNIFGQS